MSSKATALPQPLTRTHATHQEAQRTHASTQCYACERALGMFLVARNRMEAGTVLQEHVWMCGNCYRERFMSPLPNPLPRYDPLADHNGASATANLEAGA